MYSMIALLGLESDLFTFMFGRGKLENISVLVSSNVLWY